MKSKFILALVFAGLFLSSCHFTYRGKPEEMAIPLVRAVQDNDVKAAFCLTPSRDLIDEVVNSNAGLLGNPYTNKYTTDYRVETLKAKLTADFDIANTISKKDGLEWNKVLIGTVNTEDVSLEDASYTRVTINLRFPSGDYILAYNAVKSQSRGWFLANDVYFGKPLPVASK